MGIGRLLVWLRPNALSEDVFIPAHIATEIREKLIRADRLSMLIAIASSHLPEDPYTKRLRDDLILALEAFEARGDYDLALVKLRPEQFVVVKEKPSFRSELIKCGQNISRVFKWVRDEV
jgi:hypothetical protein